MTEYWTIFFYAASVPVWFLIWGSAHGYKLMSENKLLYIPFFLGVIYLSGNALLTYFFGEIGDISYEEGRFAYITDRAMIAVQATASVLIVATIVYGLTIKRVPVHFIRFMVYSFVAILGIMAPLLWVPIELPHMFYIVRHVQSIALNMGLFLCVAGISVLLRDLLTHGDAKINFLHFNSMDTDDDSKQSPTLQSLGNAKLPMALASDASGREEG